jgi:hypothetical protein
VDWVLSLFMSFYVVQSRWSPVDWVLSLFMSFYVVQSRWSPLDWVLSLFMSFYVVQSRWSPLESTWKSVHLFQIPPRKHSPGGLQVDSVGEGKVLGVQGESKVAYGVHIIQENQLSEGILSYCKGNCGPSSPGVETSRSGRGSEVSLLRNRHRY